MGRHPQRSGVSGNLIIKLLNGVRVDEKSSIDFRNYFLILTFIGDGYVLINHGQVNAGYAVVPGIWTVICFGFYRNGKRD